LERCKPKIRQAKQFLIGELHRIGFAVVPSRANFFLIRVGDAKAFRTDDVVGIRQNEPGLAFDAPFE
ncbi:hypothetical protein LCGC14_1998490, partial [marine sediment metagenome]